MSKTWMGVAALYAVVGLAIGITLWHWHSNPRFKEFTLLDLVAEDGKIAGRKFMEFGAWVTATVAFVVMTIRGSVTEGWLLTYTSVFVLGRAVGQGINTFSSVKKAEINRGQGASVEEQEADERRGR